MEVPQIIYLDPNFLASVSAALNVFGIPESAMVRTLMAGEEVKEHEHVKGGGLQTPVIEGKLGTSSKSSTQQQAQLEVAVTHTLTRHTLVWRTREELLKKSQLTILQGRSFQNLAPGQLVEARVQFFRTAASITSQIRFLLDLLAQVDPSVFQMIDVSPHEQKAQRPQAKQQSGEWKKYAKLFSTMSAMLKGVEDYLRDGSHVLVAGSLSGSREPGVFIAPIDYTNCVDRTLTILFLAECTVLGKVIRILGPGEEFSLVPQLPDILISPIMQLAQQAFSKATTGDNHTMPTSATLTGPGIVLLPIVIYL